MKTTFKVYIITILATLLLACGSSSTGPSGIQSLDDARARAVQLVPGSTATAAESTVEKGLRRWVVEVQMSSGAKVEVEFGDDGVLLELKDFTGPFNYDLTPPVTGALSFSQASNLALKERAGTVLGWKFEVEDGATVWEVYVRDPNARLWEIKMDGKTGAISGVVEKASMT